jgi:hypothetical protein
VAVDTVAVTVTILTAVVIVVMPAGMHISTAIWGKITTVLLSSSSVYLVGIGPRDLLSKGVYGHGCI